MAADAAAAAAAAARGRADAGGCRVLAGADREGAIPGGMLSVGLVCILYGSDMVGYKENMDGVQGSLDPRFAVMAMITENRRVCMSVCAATVASRQCPRQVGVARDDSQHGYHGEMVGCIYQYCI